MTREDSLLSRRLRDRFRASSSGAFGCCSCYCSERSTIRKWRPNNTIDLPSTVRLQDGCFCHGSYSRNWSDDRDRVCASFARLLSSSLSNVVKDDKWDSQKIRVDTAFRIEMPDRTANPPGMRRFSESMVANSMLLINGYQVGLQCFAVQCPAITNALDMKSVGFFLMDTTVKYLIPALIWT
ncbi:uncharacterized protein MEPE_02326 [Melanopsichium pennsylvanicum]|uniref:Uncharacterized protein n=1 Tax=Melanopsichium pennsylvanicum TaxID=63383 RepID=A0AAJ4XJ66_9BASI|nr:uncharacterized protein MEPE_02326 [Melanopsichium pennsylvanicum]